MAQRGHHHGLALFGWTTGFAAAGWALWRLGRLPFLAIDWSHPLGWLRRSDPETALAALACQAGLLIVGWVLISSLAYFGARLAGTDPARVDWLTIGPVRRTIDALLAGSLVVIMSPLAASASDAPGLPFESPAPVTSETTSSTGPSGQVSPQYVPVPAGAGDPTAVPSHRVARNEDEPTRVVVRPGDSLWKLAESRLETVQGRRPDDSDIAAYWVKVIDANRDRIRSGDPDLIFPGEEIALPPIGT